MSRQPNLDAIQLTLDPGWSPTGDRTAIEELNTVEWPLAVLTKASPKGVTAIDFLVESAKGAKPGRKWRVTAGPEGIPTHTDRLVLLVLSELSREQGLDSATVSFTRNQLVRMLGWVHSGASYQRLEQALRRWATVSVQAENVFRYEGKPHKELTFHIFEEVAMGSADKTYTDRYYVRWSDVMFASMSKRYIKNTNVGFMLSLGTPLSQALYHYLDKKRWNAKEFTIGVRRLACDHLGMSRNTANSGLKRQFEKAHTELIHRGFLESVEIYTAGSGEPTCHYVFVDSEDVVYGPDGLPPPEAVDITARQAIERAEDEVVQAKRRERTTLDAYVAAHPELLSSARDIVHERVPRAHDGSRAFESMVKEEARCLARAEMVLIPG